MAETLHTLVVDDEQGIRFFLEKTLSKSGHSVTTAASGEEALDALRDKRFDLMLLDLRLGGRVDGLRVLEAVRWRWPSTVVIMLTAHGSLESAQAAIEEGVDGYLLKPVEPREVREAIKEALERRERVVESHAETRARDKHVQRGPFFVDRKKYVATYQGEPLDLTRREFKLLVHLMDNTERVISPPELVRVARDYDPDDIQEARDIIKWYIHRLRQKVEPEPSDPQYIVNVRGVGYRFVDSGLPPSEVA
ncbi:MAG: response regulator transcription factor [Anaerolineae bacterium]|nr:response regulator transcription factor [Anaerolineae bacterium]